MVSALFPRIKTSYLHQRFLLMLHKLRPQPFPKLLEHMKEGVLYKHVQTHTHTYNTISSPICNIYYGYTTSKHLTSSVSAMFQEL